jgi:hypothetical protein
LVDLASVCDEIDSIDSQAAIGTWQSNLPVFAKLSLWKLRRRLGGIFTASLAQYC